MAEIRKLIISFLAPFLLGLSIGGAGLNCYIGYHIDELHLHIRTLEEQLISSHNEIKQLELNLMDKKHPVLTAINIYVNVEDDELTKLELEQVKIETTKDVKKRLEYLIEQELSKINFQQIAPVIDEREITLNNKTFIQKVNLVIVKEKLDIYMTTQPQKKPTVSKSQPIKIVP